MKASLDHRLGEIGRGLKYLVLLLLVIVLILVIVASSLNITSSSKYVRSVQKLFSIQVLGNKTVVLVDPSISNNGRSTALEDVYIAVTTTRKFHQSRMKWLLLTWVTSATNQTYIYTDGEDKMLQKELPDGHVVNTACGTGHGRSL